MGFSNKESKWRQNPDSDQFRVYNNSLVESLKLFEFQSEMYESIRISTLELLALLEPDS